MQGKRMISIDMQKRVELTFTLEELVNFYDFFKKYDGGTPLIFRETIEEILRNELFNQFISEGDISPPKP